MPSAAFFNLVASSAEPSAAAVIPPARLKPLTSIFSWFPMVISSSFKFRNSTTELSSSDNSFMSFSSLSGSAGNSIPTVIPAS